MAAVGRGMEPPRSKLQSAKYTRVRKYVYTLVYTYIRAYIVYTRVYTYIRPHICIYGRIYVYMCVYTYTRGIYVYTHVYTYIRTYIRVYADLYHTWQIAIWTVGVPPPLHRPLPKKIIDFFVQHRYTYTP